MPTIQNNKCVEMLADFLVAVPNSKIMIRQHPHFGTGCDMHTLAPHHLASPIQPAANAPPNQTHFSVWQIGLKHNISKTIIHRANLAHDVTESPMTTVKQRNDDANVMRDTRCWARCWANDTSQHSKILKHTHAQFAHCNKWIQNMLEPKEKNGHAHFRTGTRTSDWCF